jgi:hypothetical protein
MRKPGKQWLNIQLTLYVFICWSWAKALENHNLIWAPMKAT